MTGVGEGVVCLDWKSTRPCLLLSSGDSLRSLKLRDISCLAKDVRKGEEDQDTQEPRTPDNVWRDIPYCRQRAREPHAPYVSHLHGKF